MPFAFTTPHETDFQTLIHRQDHLNLENNVNTAAQLGSANVFTADQTMQGLTITTDGLTVTAGGATVTAGGLTVSAGSVEALSTDNYFGPYAAGTGTNVSRLHLLANAGTSMTLSAEGDGAGSRNLNFRTMGTAGTFQWQTSAGGTAMALNPTSGQLQVLLGGILASTGGITNFTVDTSGLITSLGTNSKFGTGALGANGAFARLGDEGDAANSYLIADGSGTSTNVGLVLRTKGTGTFQLQTGAGVTLVTVDSAGKATINLPADGRSLLLSRGTTDIRDGSVFISRDANTKPQSLVFGTGIAYNYIMGRPASQDYLSFGVDGGGGFVEGIRFGTNNPTIQATGTDHRFGPFALGTGTSVSDLHIGNDANGAYLTVEGDGANRNITMQAKGTGAVTIQNGTGATTFLTVQTADSNIGASGTAISVLRYNNGAVVSGAVSVGAADSGGVGFRVLRVPN